jgi:SAM-dependent methyltransferase
VTVRAPDPTARFSDRAADYARHRPSYPAHAIDAVLEGLGDPARLVAADVGAGTGISARLLADRGVRVVAVEPNRAMREAAQPHPRVEWRDGTAEATGLEGTSVDLVLCAQSFHWFRRDEALAEFRRVLRPGGRVALLWNERDERDPATAAYGRLVVEAAGEERNAFFHRAESVGFPPAPGFSAPREVPLEGHAQTHDLEGLVGRATSASYVPKVGRARDELERGLRSLHGRFAGPDGRVRLAYRCRLFLAEAASVSGAFGLPSAT